MPDHYAMPGLRVEKKSHCQSRSARHACTLIIASSYRSQTEPLRSRCLPIPSSLFGRSEISFTAYYLTSYPNFFQKRAALRYVGCLSASSLGLFCGIVLPSLPDIGRQPVNHLRVPLMQAQVSAPQAAPRKASPRHACLRQHTDRWPRIVSVRPGANPNPWACHHAPPEARRDRSANLSARP